MHIFSILLVISGLIALVLSLVPLTEICRHKTSYRIGWRAMFGLVLVFILGYIFYCYHLWFKAPDFLGFILAGIFAGGGVFVVLVSRMSLASLNELQVTALEHEKQTLHDLLTGLPNRKSMMLTLANTVAASGRGDAYFAVMVLDLNGFKKVNDTLGHQAGDAALQIIAPRLSGQLRVSDMLCRMGGDEFCVILPQANRGDAEQVAKKMLAACTEPMIVENNKMILGVSIGIALSPDHTSEVSELIRYADKAMYQAKQQKTGFEVYSKTINGSSNHKLSDAPDILQALEDKQLVLYYQPVFFDEILTGLEVSLNWHREDGSIIGAQDFLKSLVDLGASWPLIKYVVDESFINYCDWKEQFDSEFNLRLNLFIGGVDKNEFCDFLVSKALQYQIPTSNIMVEITEAILSRQSIRSVVNQLRNKGFKIVLDDFGDGGARLLSLRSTVLDEVKLDLLVARKSAEICLDADRLDRNSLDEVLINCMKSYSDYNNVAFVVSNVCDISTLNLLKRMGVNQFQGDVFCPFISTKEMNGWLFRYFESSQINN